MTTSPRRHAAPSDEHVRSLYESTAGDEKHSSSSASVIDVLTVLYGRVLRHRPSEPAWEGRDRFLLSKGHGPLALYSILAAHGYFPEAELGSFLALDSRLGGHPDRLKVPGVEISTGSLGHGVPMAVGVALGLRAKDSDRRVYVLLGDGEANEGSVWESILLAGSLRLANLSAILIDNDTSAIDLGDMVAKLEAFGWSASRAPSHDHAALQAGLQATDPVRPSALVVDWSRP